MDGPSAPQKQRVTLVTLFDAESLERIDALASAPGEPLCKVPYRDGVPDRFGVDTLPYHLTIAAWDKAREAEVIDALRTIDVGAIRVLVDRIGVMDGANGSQVLYLAVAESEALLALQRQVYDLLPTEKYNPETFRLHITLHIDQDRGKVERLREQLAERFQPFEVAFSELGLFEIYPAKLVCKV